MDKEVLIGQKSKPHGKIWLAAVILVIAAIGAGIFFLISNTFINKTYGADIYINGVAYDRNITEILLSGTEPEDYSVLNEFENLQTIDVQQLDITIERYEEIAQILGGKDIVWSVPFNGTKVSSNIESLALTADIPTDQLAAVKYFNHLKKISVENYPLCDELYAVVKDKIVSGSDCEFSCTAEIYGKDIDSSTIELILNDTSISDLTELRNAIRFFPNLTKIEMCGCGVSNESMGRLREEFPEINFVWIVDLQYYKLRTDTLVFSTQISPGDPAIGADIDFSLIFKYCTELRALDLGHHDISDISDIVNLKKLQVLILADNALTDISPLAELKELNYLELFFNEITDFSCLGELEKLEDINICFNEGAENVTSLLKCKNLKRVFVSNCGLSDEVVRELKNGMPDGCKFNATADNAIYEGWRFNEKNPEIRETFKQWQRVTAYEDWANVTYADK